MQKPAKKEEMREDDKTQWGEGGETQASEMEKKRRRKGARYGERYTVAPVSNLGFVSVPRQASLKASLPLNGPDEYVICLLSFRSFIPSPDTYCNPLCFWSERNETCTNTVYWSCTRARAGPQSLLQELHSPEVTISTSIKRETLWMWQRGRE